MFDGLFKFPARRVGLLDALTVELVVFDLGKFLGHLMRDFAGVDEDIAVVDGEESVELRDPVAHVHGCVFRSKWTTDSDPKMPVIPHTGVPSIQEPQLATPCAVAKRLAPTRVSRPRAGEERAGGEVNSARFGPS